MTVSNQKKALIFLFLSLAVIVGALSFSGVQTPKSEFEQFQNALDNLFYVQQINASYSSQAGFRSIQEEQDLTTVGLLLKNSAAPLTEEELASVFHYQSALRLYPSLTIASDSGGLVQYGIVSDDGKTYYAFRAEGESMVPVAAILASSVNQVSNMAMFQQEDSRISLLISVIGVPLQYRFTDGDEKISRLTQLFLGSPELLETNALPQEGLLEKWLEEWTDGYEIGFGRPVPFRVPDNRDVWYARALAQGSSYTLIIPDSLAEDMTSICRGQPAQDLYLPTEVPGPAQ